MCHVALLGDHIEHPGYHIDYFFLVGFVYFKIVQLDVYKRNNPKRASPRPF